MIRRNEDRGKDRIVSQSAFTDLYLSITATHVRIIDRFDSSTLKDSLVVSPSWIRDEDLFLSTSLVEVIELGQKDGSQMIRTSSRNGLTR